MFYSVNSYSSMGTRKGLSGLVSNMDTDAMVESMTARTRGKITTQLQKKQTALWKQESYREVTSKISDFQKKYLTYSSGSSNISSPNFFKTGSIVNNSKFVKVSGNTDAAKNVVIKDILELAETARFSAEKKFSSQKITSGKIEDSWHGSDVNGMSLRVKVGDSEYNVTVGSDFAFPKNADGSEQSNDQKLRSLIDELNKGLSGNPDLKDKVEFQAAGDGKVRFVSLDNETEIQIMKSDVTEHQKLYEGLGFVPTNSPSTEIVGNPGDISKVYSDRELNTTLEGSTITINYNGVDKVISFDAADNIPGSMKYANSGDMVRYLQKKIDAAFGSGRISAELNANNELVMKTVGEGATNSTLYIKSSTSKGVLGANSGALRLPAGIGNRVSWNTQIKDLGTQLGTPLTKNADGKFEMTINGVKIELDENNTLNDMITKINASAAGVKVSYSTTSDTFSMVSTESGINGKVNVTPSDPAGSNLADALFGNASDREITIGRDAKLEVSFDGGRTSSVVTRSSNSFTLDGLNVELLGKTDDPGIDLTNQSLEIQMGGNTYNIKVGADFKLDTALSTGDKAVALMKELNKSIEADPGLNGKIKFEMQNGKIALNSVDGTTKFAVSAGTSQIMRDALGLGSSTAEEVSFESTGNYQLETSVKENISFSVENNTDELVKKLMTFIDDYNQIIKLADAKIYEKQDRNYTPLTDEQKKEMSEDEIKVWEAKAKEGILANDQYLNTAITKLREAMSNPVDGLSTALSKLGIQTADYLDNGQLTVNEESLRKAIADDPDSISKMFTQTFGDPTKKEDVAKAGIAARLSFVIDGLAGPEGLLVKVAGKKNDLVSGQDRLSTQVRSIDAELKKLKANLKSEEDRLFAQFSYMENYLNQMNSQSSWLTQQTGG